MATTLSLIGAAILLPVLWQAIMLVVDVVQMLFERD